MWALIGLLLVAFLTLLFVPALFGLVLAVTFGATISYCVGGNYVSN